VGNTTRQTVDFNLENEQERRQNFSAMKKKKKKPLQKKFCNNHLYLKNGESKSN
jgi:hypothetical protein